MCLVQTQLFTKFSIYSWLNPQISNSWIQRSVCTINLKTSYNRVSFTSVKIKKISLVYMRPLVHVNMASTSTGTRNDAERSLIDQFISGTEFVTESSHQGLNHISFI